MVVSEARNPLRDNGSESRDCVAPQRFDDPLPVESSGRTVGRWRNPWFWLWGGAVLAYTVFRLIGRDGLNGLFAAVATLAAYRAGRWDEAHRG